MKKGVFYDEKAKKFVHVSQGPQGNYSFYRTKNLHNAGARIRGLNNVQMWFGTEKQALKALPEFAKKRGFVFLSYDQVLSMERSEYINNTGKLA